MTKKYSVPRGTNDILPTDVIFWQKIEAQARQLCGIYGYKEIRTPIFEELGLFQRSLGETSDVVNKQLLTLSSDKKEGYALRPEGTASVVRSYIENSLDKKEGISKLFYIGPMFRGERPQKGRLRQFHQIGVEVIGPNSCLPYLDADVIALGVNIIKNFGIQDFQLRINTLGSAEDKENFSKLLRTLLKPRLKELCEDCQNRFERNAFRILDCKNETCHKVVHQLKIGHSYLSESSREYFSNVKKALDSLNIVYLEDPFLVRGLDYYTHTVFEISSPSLGSQDALGAGGRYSTLVEDLGGPQADAIGFALGIERILLAMPKTEEVTASPLNTFLVTMDDISFQKGFNILSFLRAQGISCDMSYKISSMKSQMRLADKMNSKSVIIIGENEIKKEVVTLKDMASGNQEEVDIKKGNFSQLTQILKERYKS